MEPTVELATGQPTPSETSNTPNPEISTLPIPQELQKEVDPTTWGRLTYFDNLESPTPQQISGHIGFLIECWRLKELTGQALWSKFAIEFEDWDRDSWGQVPMRMTKYIRAYLLANGVFVDTDGARIAANLERVVKLTSFRVWTTEEINALKSRNIEFRKNMEDPEFASDIQTVDKPWQPQPIPVPRTSQVPQPREHSQTPWLPERQYQGHRGTPTHTPKLYRPKDTSIPHYDPPQDTKQLTDLVKLYANDDMKYGGDTYEVIESKLMIFYDCCHRLGISQWQYASAFPTMLKGRALTFYYDRLCGDPEPRDFQTMVNRVKGYFENEERSQMYLSNWRNTTLLKVVNENPGKPKTECLELLFDKLTRIQRALPSIGQSEESLRVQVLNACRGVRECTLCLYSPAPTLEGIRSQLRSAVSLATDTETQQFPATSHEEPQQFWTDRTYNGRGRAARFGNGRTRGNPRRGNSGFAAGRADKKCYVCGKLGCWSTTHPTEERRQAYDRFRNSRHTQDRSTSAYAQFLAWYEGIEGVEDDDQDDGIAQFFQATEDDQTVEESEDDRQSHSTFFNNSTPADAHKITALLADTAVLHGLTKEDPFKEQKQEPSTTNFTLEGRYSATTFHGIMPDSGAAGVSTAGQPQFQALQRELPTVTLDQTTVGKATVRFGGGNALESLGTTTVPTPLGPMDFHVIPADTPFLLCLQDMDRLGIRFDNLRNHLQQGNLTVPVVRKWGHPWLQLSMEKTLAYNYLTEVELRRLHRRFGHPSVAPPQIPPEGRTASRD
jgi:hypothetical protein